MGKKIDEGFLFDLLEKRRAGHFTADELGWAADHPEVIRWAVSHLHVVEGLRNGNLKTVQCDPFLVTYNQSLGLRRLIELAVGQENLGNINRFITPERFKLAGNGLRIVNLRIEPILKDESCDCAAQRLIDAEHTLATVGDLAGLMMTHPRAMTKWEWVFAVDDDSRWVDDTHHPHVVYASVHGTVREFKMFSASHQFTCSRSGVIVCA